MPAALRYPGVYIEEVSSGVHPITGVATSIAVFVGYTRKGIPDKAVSISGFADFERQYGGLDRESPLSYAVRQFFMNGGAQALIVRVASGYASAAWTLQDDTPIDVLDIVAASPGAWGNDLRISVETEDTVVVPPASHPEFRNPNADFNLVVSRKQNDGTTARIEMHRNLSMNSWSPQFVESVVNNSSTAIRVTRRSGLTFNDPGFALSEDISGLFPLSASDTTIAGTIDGTEQFLLTLAAGPWPAIADLVSAVDDAITAWGLGIQASESGAGGSAGTGFLKLESATPGERSSIVIAGGAFSGLAQTISLGLANGGVEIPGATEHRPAAVSDIISLTPGADGSKGGAVELLGNQSNKTGIYALRDVDLFNILCIPETFGMTAGQEAGLIPPAVELCEKQRAFYIIDAPSNRTLDDIAEWPSMPNSRNAAVYFPAVRIVDPRDGMRPRPMAPSGTVAGVYARTDATRGVWKAPAGTDATLKGVLGLTSPVNDTENGDINIKGINALRNFPVYGQVVWGARTTKGANAEADEYKYIPVRRLALFLEESLYRGTQWVVFEPNDEPLWSQIRLNVGSFMQTLFRKGAFQGTTPKEAYFVKCDKEITTQDDINLGIVNILVGFAALKPAEFVVIQIQQMAGQGAS